MLWCFSAGLCTIHMSCICPYLIKTKLSIGLQLFWVLAMVAGMQRSLICIIFVGLVHWDIPSQCPDHWNGLGYFWVSYCSMINRGIICPYGETFCVWSSHTVTWQNVFISLRLGYIHVVWGFVQLWVLATKSSHDALWWTFSALPQGGAKDQGAHDEAGQHDGGLPVPRRERKLLQDDHHQPPGLRRRHGLCPGWNPSAGGGPVTQATPQKLQKCRGNRD